MWEQRDGEGSLGQGGSSGEGEVRWVWCYILKAELNISADGM